jgi:hypothetical protein
MGSFSSWSALGSLSHLKTVAYIVLDSMRQDSFEAARTPNIDRLCPLQERRHSYATWTQPSHSCLLSGLLPFVSRPNSLAADTYTEDLALWSEALAGDPAKQAGFAPDFSLARFARASGWHTIGQVAMPVLNEQTCFSRGFHSYGLTETGGHLGAQVEYVLELVNSERQFIFINCGDTHYPYLLPKSQLPRISGLNGVAQGRFGSNLQSHPRAPLPFTIGDYRDMHASQIAAVERADRFLQHLVDALPKPMLLIVTSDHGELFGEEGYFGHGPFFHPLLFAVPVAMGVVS